MGQPPKPDASDQHSESLHSKHNETSGLKCSQCPGNFFSTLLFQGRTHDLCLNCFLKIQDMHSRVLEQQVHEINYLKGIMESNVGVPYGTLPRYPLPQPRPKTILGDLVFNHIKVDRSAIGVINTGTIAGNLQSIDASISLLCQDPLYKDFVSAIQQLSEATLAAQGASKEQQEAIIERLDMLLEQARQPKEKRRPSIVKSVLKELRDYTQCIASLKAIWDTAGPVISQIFS